MAVVVAARRPGARPGLASSLPASLFGKFTTNGKAAAEVHKPVAKTGVRGAEVQKAGAKAASRGAKSSPDKAHTAVPKDDAVRSEPYLRLVAARPCKHCGRQKHSQAAHLPPQGKGIKQDDRDTFPLCADAPRRRGCHPKFDNYELFPHAKAVKQGRKWAAETRAEIEAEGLWPKKVPKWPKVKR